MRRGDPGGRPAARRPDNFILYYFSPRVRRGSGRRDGGLSAHSAGTTVGNAGGWVSRPWFAEIECGCRCGIPRRLSETGNGIDIRDDASWLGDSSVHWHQIATIIRNG
jgi:hypothetical protein